MSIRAVSWALYDVTGIGPTQKLVLVGLAEVAGGDGRHAYPAQSTLAEMAGISVRQVRNVLKELLDHGLISYGDPRHVDHIPANRRPTVYDLSLTSQDRMHSLRKRLSTKTLDGERKAGRKPPSGLGGKPASGPERKSSASRAEVRAEAHFRQTENQEINPAAAAPHECNSGWIGSDDAPAPCPICKPHLRRPTPCDTKPPQLPGQTSVLDVIAEFTDDRRTA